VKAPPVVYFQDIYTLADALQICKFITSHNGHGINIQDMADLYSAVTGVDADEESLRTVANRIYTLERCFSVREGITKKDDFLLGKWVSEPTHGGPFDGCSFDKEKFSTMLEDYYHMRGWNTETGIPEKKTLGSLGLDDIAHKSEKKGK